MEVASLGYRTDLALLRLGGSVIEDHGDHLVVRTPHNPTYWWGNFLLLAAPPAQAETSQWLDTFTRTFPDAEHRALGFDGVTGSVRDLAGFRAAGLTVEGQTVMTAAQVHAPPRPNVSADYRPLASDDDWAQHVDLRLVCYGENLGAGRDRDFATARAETMRALIEAGHGAWFGAFLDGRLVSSLGLFRTEAGLARFQSVETHPDLRGRGLAGTLVHAASRYGLTELGAHTLVMVADPEYSAIRLYRSLGFADTETQLQAERAPAAAAAQT
jgi:ribosomal protein S18 acetylase RimI-like enzyme